MTKACWPVPSPTTRPVAPPSFNDRTFLDELLDSSILLAEEDADATDEDDDDDE